MNGFLQKIRGLTTWRGSNKQIRMTDAPKLCERQKTVRADLQKKIKV